MTIAEKQACIVCGGAGPFDSWETICDECSGACDVCYCNICDKEMLFDDLCVHIWRDGWTTCGPGSDEWYMGGAKHLDVRHNVRCWLDIVGIPVAHDVLTCLEADNLRLSPCGPLIGGPETWEMRGPGIWGSDVFADAGGYDWVDETSEEEFDAIKHGMLWVAGLCPNVKEERYATIGWVQEWVREHDC